jgi:hypothetical protein
MRIYKSKCFVFPEEIDEWINQFPEKYLKIEGYSATQSNPNRGIIYITISYEEFETKGSDDGAVVLPDSCPRGVN